MPPSGAELLSDIETPSDALIAERLRAILASDEFDPQPSDRLARWLRELDEALSAWLLSLDGASAALAVGVVLVALAAVAWVIVQLFDPALRRRAPGSADSAREERAPTAASLMEKARALADAGALRDAARALQAAVLQAACAKRGLRWRPALSDWEWLALLDASAGVVALTRSTERLAFGPEPTRAAFDACESTARALAGGGGRESK